MNSIYEFGTQEYYKYEIEKAEFMLKKTKELIQEILPDLGDNCLLDELGFFYCLLKDADNMVKRAYDQMDEYVRSVSEGEKP